MALPLLPLLDERAEPRRRDFSMRVLFFFFFLAAFLCYAFSGKDELHRDVQEDADGAKNYEGGEKHPFFLLYMRRMERMPCDDDG